MTLEAWVNPQTVSNAWRDVIYKGNDNYYLEATSSNGRPAGGGTFGTGGGTSKTFGASPLAVNTWTHLAVTYNGTTLSLYVNGILISSRAQSGNVATSVNPLEIGGDAIFGQYFSGVIDELRVFNVARTQAQVQSDMTTPLAN